MQAALRSYVWSVEEEIHRHTRDIRDEETGTRCRMQCVRTWRLTPSLPLQIPRLGRYLHLGAAAR